jgi:hypothetical protein
MGRILFDQEASGLQTFVAEEDGKDIFQYVQDVTPTLELAKELAKTDDHWREGMKREMVHAAFIPDVIIVEMMVKHGVSIYKKEDRNRVLNLLDTEYPHLKTVNKKLSYGRS